VLASFAVIATAATIAAYAQRNRSRRQLETLRHQRALDDERARISRDMHDEVGASLTEIAILSELAVRRDDQRTQRNELDKIAGRSRRMLDAIGEIIWALDPGHDRSDHLASYLREFSAGYLESAGLRAELSFATTDSASTLTSEFRRNVFLILKEALANVAKHAHANTVRVELVQHDDHLLLTVSDDGVGIGDKVDGSIGAAVDERTADSIDTTVDARHHGLTNMRQRASALGAALSIEALPGGGTRVHLDAPLPAGAVA
jgi:signal transduction histidine kinase